MPEMPSVCATRCSMRPGWPAEVVAEQGRAQLHLQEHAQQVEPAARRRVAAPPPFRADVELRLLALAEETDRGLHLLGCEAQLLHDAAGRLRSRASETRPSALAIEPITVKVVRKKTALTSCGSPLAASSSSSLLVS